MTKLLSGSSVRWFHEVKVDGSVAFRAGKGEVGLVAQWPALGVLTCRRDGGAATFSPAAGASPRAIAKLRRAQVRGLLRDLAGRLTVHASAVAIEGRAVLFLGSNGAGKSTAAAEMCLRHGAQMLADDAASLETGPGGVYVSPFEEDHWLARDSCEALGVSPRRGVAGDKSRLRAATLASEPCPLALILALRFDPSSQAAVSRPLRGAEAARWLLEGIIRFDVEDGGARYRELEQVTSVYKSAPFFELVRPLHPPGMIAGFVFNALGQGAT